MRSSLQRDSSSLQGLSRRNISRSFRSSSWKDCITFILFPSIPLSTRANSTNWVLPLTNCLKVWISHRSLLWFASPSSHRFAWKDMIQGPARAFSKAWLSTTTGLTSTKILGIGSTKDQTSPNLTNQTSTRMLQSSPQSRNLDPSSNQ